MNRILGKSFRLWAFMAMASCVLRVVHAASSVMIWPVDPVIEEDQHAVALWLENRGSDNVSLQIRVFGWSQSGTEENFENQEQLIASPPLATIPTGQRQLVRLMNTGPVPDGKELAYRVLIDELPDSDAAKTPGDNMGGSAIGVKLQIRYSIPLFVNGKGVWTKPPSSKGRDAAMAAKPELHWRSVHEGNAYYLAVRNTGAAHARLTSVQWVGSGQAVSINAGLLGYVLAGSEMRWLLTEPPPIGYVPEAKINGSETALKLPAQ